MLGKRDKTRIIPMTTEIRELLAVLLAMHHPTEYVFTYASAYTRRRCKHGFDPW